MTNSPRPKSWRAVLPVHPAAELFPTMSESELRELGESIANGGLREAVHLYKGKLLDGRNRLDAMELVGFTFDDAGLSGVAHHLNDSVDPFDYVIAANLHRRHLTSEQKRELITKILKAKPAASNVTIAKQAKADDKTVAKVRRKLESTSEIPRLEKTVGADGKQRKAKKKPKPAPKPGTEEYERDRKEFIALDLKVKEAERQLAQWDLDHPATASAEVSVEQRQAEMAQLATAPDDLVDQAIRLVEQMTADQRREFIARLSDTLKVVIVSPIPADLSIPDSLKRAPPNGRGPR